MTPADESLEGTVNELFRRMLFLPEQASTVARDVDFLHYIIITTTMVAATLIFGTAAYFLIRYRRRSETEVTRNVQGTLGWEVLFVGLPLTTFLMATYFRAVPREWPTTAVQLVSFTPGS